MYRKQYVETEEADDHAEEARNKSTDEDALNQTSRVIEQMSDEVTCLLQSIEHLVHLNSRPAAPRSDGPFHGDFDVQIEACHESLSYQCDASVVHKQNKQNTNRW